MKHLRELIDYAKKCDKMKLAVAAAEDEHVLDAVMSAYKEGIIIPVLVGDVDKIRQIAKEQSFPVEELELLESSSLEESAEKTVKLVSSGKADFLMKGLCDTSIIMKAVLNKEWGLRTGRLISHVMMVELPKYHKLLALTDGGMNISPNVDQKKDIIDNAITVCKSLGLKKVNVACLAAKEKPSDKMPATMDAAELQKRCREGQFEEGVTVEGPLAIDLCFSKEAADIKKFESDIAGEVDVMLFPNIEMGNGVAKTMTYMADANSAGIIMGASKPIVLVSRADTAEIKLNSIALGSVIAAYLK